MKLRLRGNSLRLRLSQTDLRAFLETGAVRETTAFGGDSAVTYALEAVDERGGRARRFSEPARQLLSAG